MATERKRVYVWEVPVRLTHWIFVICILAFSFTGLYIGHPFIYALSSKQYIMGWMRFIHFVTGYVFLMSFIIRLYWSVVGNRYACFTVWFPFSAQKIKDIFGALKFYLLLSRKPPYSVGHTALASVTYLVVYLIFLFEICSGFALYSVTHSGTIWTVLGGWMLRFMHLPTIRLYHHLFMYVILAFAIFHVYIATFADSKEKNGLLVSMFSGYKFVTGKEWE